MSIQPQLTVAAALLRRGSRVLIARRKSSDSFGGKWEFPGGKVEPGETLEICLVREIKEELNLNVTVHDLISSNSFDYGSLAVTIYLFEVTECGGVLKMHDHEAIAWVLPSELHTYDMLAADAPFIPLIAQRYASL